MINATHRAPVRARRQWGRGLAAVTLAVGLGCSTDRILKVERPDIIDPNGLNNAGGVSALYAGILGDMSNIMGQALGAVAFVGLITDELKFGATPPEVRQVDQRVAPESNTLVGNMYRTVQQLRGQAGRTAAALEAQDASDVRIGEAKAVAGFAHVLLAEMFCSGIPLGAPGENAQPSTTTEVLQAGVNILTSAVTDAGSDANGRNFASVVLGRAYLDLGQFAEASAAVAGVPTSFLYTSHHAVSTEYQKNNFYDYMFNNDGLLVSDREGINGLDFATAGDPRVPIDGDGSPSRFDKQTARYYFLGANSLTAPMLIASGVEARLIEAEAALNAGNTTLWLSKLNEARDNYEMSHLTDPGTEDARVDLMFRERAFSLFASAHRLGDMRRLVRQYGRGAETVFPTGAYHKDGLTLGPDVQFVIPQTERNNPNFNGCIDRNP